MQRNGCEKEEYEIIPAREKCPLAGRHFRKRFQKVALEPENRESQSVRISATAASNCGYEPDGSKFSRNSALKKRDIRESDFEI